MLTIFQGVIATVLAALLWMIVGLNREVGELKTMFTAQRGEIQILSAKRTEEVSEIRRRIEVLERRK